MRRYLLTAVIPIVLVLLTGCINGPGFWNSESTVYPDEPPVGIRITAAVPGFSGLDSAMTELAADFNSRNEYGIDVGIVPVGSGFADIIICDPLQALQLVNEGQAAELSSLVRHPSWGLDGGYSVFSRELRKQTITGRLRPVISSMPLLCGGQVLIVNLDMLEQAATGSFPIFRPGFNRLLKRLDSGKASAMAVDDADDTFISMVQAGGGRLTLFAGRVYFPGSPSALRTAAWLRRLAGQGLIREEGFSYENQTGFVFGETAMVLTGIEGIGRYDMLLRAADTGVRAGIRILPSGLFGAGVTVETISAAVTAEDVQNRLAAWLFLKWLVESPQQIRLAGLTGLVPAESAAAGMISDGYGNFGGLWVRSVDQFRIARRRGRPLIYLDKQAEADLTELAESLFRGKRTGLEAIRMNFRMNSSGYRRELP